MLLLWRNTKSIILGKHQCAWKECKLDKIKEDQVTVARRPSGGGAVYQDLGNTCFSIQRPVDSSNFTFMVDKNGHSYYGNPNPEEFKNLNNDYLCGVLKNLGVEAKPAGRSDLVVNDRKISGSAYKVAGGKTLHHGTMLFDVDFTALDQYLNPYKIKLDT